MICFDLEGPLSPQDNAYEVMSLQERGRKVFEALSRYDDVIALQGRAGYEPGDTLKLIIPFLLRYGVREEDIAAVSRRARIVEGVKETVEWLRGEGEEVRVISTSYEQHALAVGAKLGIPEEHIACTRLRLDDMSLDAETMGFVGRVEEAILSEGLSKDVVKLLDELYFQKGLFNRIEVEVVGGARKVDALQSFARELGVELQKVACIGDSITDYKMLEAVSGGGGLAIAFNANKYCLPYADVAVASTDGRALIPILKAFLGSGKKAAVARALELEREPGLEAVYSGVKGKGSLEEIVRVHGEMRMKVRGEAGKLG